MENRDFIIISLNPWYTPLSCTSKQIAKELAKQNRVLYINPPLDRKTLLTRRKDPILQKHLSIIKGRETGLVQLEANLWNYYPSTILESINWLPDAGVFSRLNYLNNKRIAKYIRSVSEMLGFSDFILINDKDLFRGFYLKELLQPNIYLYYDRDYILGAPYWQKHGRNLEPQLAKKADLIVSHSEHLIGLMKPYNNNIYNIGSGIDLSLFDGNKDYQIPSELSSVERPVIGYVGALTSLRLDMEAFIRIAKERPQWTMVLVGPEDEDFKKSELHHCKNVIFCGRKKLNEIPAYINAMDVCLNLQIINAITIGNYPLKIDEYLAMGKPVVATQTIGMRPFEGYVFLVEQGEDYISAIEIALKEKHGNKARMRHARSHSWENVVNNINKAIANTIALKNGTDSQNKKQSGNKEKSALDAYA